MKHGSLFSGIGGFDLAAEWMGWDNIFHCEWMPFPRQVLHYHFPNSISYEDITKTDFTIHRGSIDILTGGFPCQPYSSAGKRLGKEDERHLWPEMLRAIQEIEPTYIVGENVRGLTNWNGGVVFEEVCADLENCGYEVQPVLLPACAIGAPHRRDRIWFVAANTNSIRFNQCECDNEINTSEGRINALNDIDENDGQGDASNTESKGLERSRFQNGFANNVFNSECIGRTEIGNDNGHLKKTQQKKCGEQQFSGTDSTQSWWRDFPSQSPVCSGDDGLPTELDGITFSKWRQESIKGYGNAIVPQVAYQIFKAIENTYTSNTHE
jgi:DNA (cytosine-5)-methyltransferase 1